MRASIICLAAVGLLAPLALGEHENLQGVVRFCPLINSAED